MGKNLHPNSDLDLWVVQPGSGGAAADLGGLSGEGWPGTGGLANT